MAMCMKLLEIKNDYNSDYKRIITQGLNCHDIECCRNVVTFKTTTPPPTHTHTPSFHIPSSFLHIILFFINWGGGGSGLFAFF